MRRARSGSASARSTAVCAAALTTTSGRSARTVSARDSGAAKSARVAAERMQLAERREGALQLPADLAVLAEEQDLHPGTAPSRPASLGRTGAVVRREPVAIGAGLHPLDPAGMVEIPAHGLAQAALERLLGPPAELALDLARVDRVASVVAGPVGHVLDQAEVRALGIGPHLVEQGADGLDDLDVRLLVPAADVVGLADPAARQHLADRGAVVLDVEPVAHLHAVAVDRQRLAGEGVDDHQRDQLFGEVIGPVVVAAVGGEHRQAVGVVPGPHQVVARRLARRVGLLGACGWLSVKAGASGRSEP